MVTFSLVVVRHGATDANEQGILQGQSDHALNEVGRLQAALLGRHFRQCQPLSSFTDVYSSDLSRAKETTRILLQNLTCTKIDAKSTEGAAVEDNGTSPVIYDSRLRERKYGVLEGKPTGTHKQEAMRSNKSPNEYTPDGGETLSELQTRVVKFFRFLCRQMETAVGALTYAVPSSQRVKTRNYSSPSSPIIGAGSEWTCALRTNRAQSASKVSKAQLLLPWPEQSSPVNSAVSTPEQTSPTAVNTPPPFPRDGDEDSTTPVAFFLTEQYNDLAQGENIHSTKTARLTAGHPTGTDMASPYESSRDSGISAVSEMSVTVDAIPEKIDRMPIKRTHSACSSPGSSNSPNRIIYETPSVRSQIFPLPAMCHTNEPRKAGSRKVSVQSIASDDTNFPDLDAKVLLVTHGGVIRELFRYFCEDLGCLMIGGKGAAMRPCPNTGVSTFMINVGEDLCEDVEQKKISVICLGLHSVEHLNNGLSSNEIFTNNQCDNDFLAQRNVYEPSATGDIFDITNGEVVDDEEEEEEENDDEPIGFKNATVLKIGSCFK